MKILSWNCRGLGNPRAVRALLRLNRLENPHLVFLTETRLKDCEMVKIRLQCGFNSGLFVSCAGQGKERAGGTALMWNDDLKVSITSYSLNHIWGSIEDEDNCVPWFFAGIYGFPEEGNKKKTWELIRRISHESNGNWICLGDLNDIFSNDEKKGGNNRSMQQLNFGRDTVCDCSLTDLGF
jgi:hypothetical protein